MAGIVFGKQTPKKGGFFHSITDFRIVYEEPEEPEEPKEPEVDEVREKQALRRADPGGATSPPAPLQIEVLIWRGEKATRKGAGPGWRPGWPGTCQPT
jgi:hypothetical protein